MSDTITVNLSSYPENVSVNLSTEVNQLSVNLVETTLTFLQGAGLHRENVFTEDNTFEQNVNIGGNTSITGNLSVVGNATLPHISGNTALTGNLTVTGNTSITGNLSTTGSVSVDNVTFDQTPELAGGVGVLRWNDADGTLDLGLKGGNVTLQLGQEQVVRVVNKTGADLLESEYKVVRIRLASEGGAQGQRLAVVLAQGNNDPDSATTLGLVTENIANNQEGFITTSGVVRGINTTGSLQGETWVDGDVLYLSPTVAGRLTKIKPQAPNHTVVVGYVEYAHQNNGKIFVKVDNGYELDELHNVRIIEPANGQLLSYDGVDNVWINSDANFLSLNGGTVNGSFSVSGDYNLNGDICSLGANSLDINVGNLNISTGDVSVFGSNDVNIGSDLDVTISGNNTIVTGSNLAIQTSNMSFAAAGYNYNTGGAGLHREALGSGAIGDGLFVANNTTEVYDLIGIRPMEILDITSGSGVINIPSDAKFVSFILIGGGGGGGSGARKASLTAASGGTGGRSGGWLALPPIPTSSISGSVTYSVGAGGSGAPAISADNTNGSAGVTGGNTTIVINGNTLFAIGGQAGNGGQINNSSGGTAAVTLAAGTIGAGVLTTIAGSANSLHTGNTTSGGALSIHIPSSGGSGGGISNTNGVFTAGAGTTIGNPAVTYSVAGGAAGTASAPLSPEGKNGNTSLYTRAGTGGGGGVATPVTFAGNRGGNGALYGGGGGGGSASNNGQPSGAGGNGASGLIQVTYWY